MIDALATGRASSGSARLLPSVKAARPARILALRSRPIQDRSPGGSHSRDRTTLLLARFSPTARFIADNEDPCHALAHLPPRLLADSTDSRDIQLFGHGGGLERSTSLRGGGVLCSDGPRRAGAGVAGDQDRRRGRSGWSFPIGIAKGTARQPAAPCPQERNGSRGGRADRPVAIGRPILLDPSPRVVVVEQQDGKPLPGVRVDPILIHFFGGPIVSLPAGLVPASVRFLGRDGRTTLLVDRAR